MDDVVQGSQGIDDLLVALVFFQFLVADGKGHGIDADAGALVGRIVLYVVDLHAQLADRGREEGQAFGGVEFQVDFKVVGLVVEKVLEDGKDRQGKEEDRKEAECRHVEADADRHAQKSHHPQGRRRRQALDLGPGIEKDGPGADNGGAEHCRPGDKKGRGSVDLQQKEIDQAGRRAGQGDGNKSPEAGAVALVGPLPANCGPQDQGDGQAQHDAGQAQMHGPFTEVACQEILADQKI